MRSYAERNRKHSCKTVVIVKSGEKGELIMQLIVQSLGVVARVWRFQADAAQRAVAEFRQENFCGFSRSNSPPFPFRRHPRLVAMASSTPMLSSPSAIKP